MRSLMKNAGRYWILLAGILFLFESSCATMRPMPAIDYKAADPAKNKTYRLITKDKRSYEFKNFAVTDSTLVILELKSYGRSSRPDDLSKIKTPVVIPWDDVKSLERRERSNGMTAFAITAGVLVVGGVVLAALWVQAITEGLSHLN
jgi:hypothetical protein